MLLGAVAHIIATLLIFFDYLGNLAVPFHCHIFSSKSGELYVDDYLSNLMACPSYD